MKVKLNSTTYKISQQNNPTPGDDEVSCCGYLDEYKKRIVIDKGLPKHVKTLTLIHELTHALLIEMGEYELTNDERFVEGFSRQIYSFLQNNNVVKLGQILGEKCG